MIAPRINKNSRRGVDLFARYTEESRPHCYCITFFTSQLSEIRDFYMQILDAKILEENENSHSVLDIAGMPVCLRKSQMGETTGYFHLHLAVKNRQPILNELRKRGIIVTHTGPTINFRDPEGRVIKLSESKTYSL
jgi:catechol-2,3-dioxygenase